MRVSTCIWEGGMSLWEGQVIVRGGKFSWKEACPCEKGCVLMGGGISSGLNLWKGACPFG